LYHTIKRNVNKQKITNVCRACLANRALSSFMTYHLACIRSKKTGGISVTGDKKIVVR